jgi:hypothetical protein
MSTLPKHKRANNLKPTKVWLELSEAAEYLSMCNKQFKKIAAENGFSVSAIGKKTYYKVSELNELLERNIIIKAA